MDAKTIEWEAEQDIHSLKILLTGLITNNKENNGEIW